MKGVVDVGALARRHARKAIAALVRQLGSTDPQASVTAAKTLLEFGHGQPLLPLALHAPTTISVVCRTSDPEAACSNGEAADTARWDA